MDEPRAYELYKNELKSKGDDYKPSRAEYDILGRLIIQEKLYHFKMRWKRRFGKLKFWRKKE